MEIWKPVKNYEGVYEVSNYGRVKNSEGKVIKGTINKGYNRICLTKKKREKNHLVHRLVLEAFGYNLSGLTVNHKDGDKLNNVLDNLEVMSTYANTEHAYKTGLRSSANIVPVIQYDTHGNKIAEYMSIREAARKTGLDGRHISRNVKGVGLQVGGYKFVKNEACID